MKNIINGSICFLSLFWSVSMSFCFAQDQKQESVFSILEKDREGRYQDRIKSYTDTKIVDINSVLQIQLDREKIISKIDGAEIGLPDSISDKINKLSSALSERKLVLATFNDLLASYDYKAFKKDPLLNKKWATSMQKTSISVLKLWDVSSYVEFGNPNDANVSARPGATYIRAQTELERMIKQVEEYADQQGVYIQFGAWIYKKNSQNDALHIPGFDSIKPKPLYEVERWKIIPTPEQLVLLEEVSALARENKDKGVSMLKETMAIQTEQFRQLLKGEFDALLDSLNQQVLEIADGRITPIVSAVNSIKQNLNRLKSTLKQKIAYYKNVKLNSERSILAVLLQIESDIAFIKEEVQAISAESIRLYTLIKNEVSSSEELEANAKEIKDFLKSWLDTTLEKESFAKIKELLIGIPLDFELLKFTNSVFKLSLRDLPTEADLDLYTTGVRQSGDRIAFKFEINSKKKSIYTENREVYLYRVLPHIESTVGVIFADPIARTNIKTQFQMAPYYNLILKGLWDQRLRRKSVSYNKIFDWGIGLHISAPDFDGDDVPELGTGLVISILKDYVQTGGAINVFTGDPYWFFGLRLPIPSFNIGSIPTTSN